MLSCLCNGAYKISLAANQKEYPMLSVLFHYLNGLLPNVIRIMNSHHKYVRHFHNGTNTSFYDLTAQISHTTETSAFLQTQMANRRALVGSRGIYHFKVSLYLYLCILAPNIGNNYISCVCYTEQFHCSSCMCNHR